MLMFVPGAKEPLSTVIEAPFVSTLPIVVLFSSEIAIETEEPFIAEPTDEVLWEFRVYVPVKDKTRAVPSITETVLPIKVPLRAGELKIIRGRIGDNGEIVPDDQEIGTSVTLDWQPGLEIVTY